MDIVPDPPHRLPLELPRSMVVAKCMYTHTTDDVLTTKMRPPPLRRAATHVYMSRVGGALRCDNSRAIADSKSNCRPQRHPAQDRYFVEPLNRAPLPGFQGHCHRPKRPWSPHQQRENPEVAADRAMQPPSRSATGRSNREEGPHLQQRTGAAATETDVLKRRVTITLNTRLRTGTPLIDAICSRMLSNITEWTRWSTMLARQRTNGQSKERGAAASRGAASDLDLQMNLDGSSTSGQTSGANHHAHAANGVSNGSDGLNNGGQSDWAGSEGAQRTAEESARGLWAKYGASSGLHTLHMSAETAGTIQGGGLTDNGGSTDSFQSKARNAARTATAFDRDTASANAVFGSSSSHDTGLSTAHADGTGAAARGGASTGSFQSKTRNAARAAIDRVNGQMATRGDRRALGDNSATMDGQRLQEGAKMNGTDGTVGGARTNFNSPIGARSTAVGIDAQSDAAIARVGRCNTLGTSNACGNAAERVAAAARDTSAAPGAQRGYRGSPGGTSTATPTSGAPNRRGGNWPMMAGATGKQVVSMTQMRAVVIGMQFGISARRGGLARGGHESAAKGSSNDQHRNRDVGQEDSDESDESDESDDDYDDTDEESGGNDHLLQRQLPKLPTQPGQVRHKRPKAVGAGADETRSETHHLGSEASMSADDSDEHAQNDTASLKTMAFLTRTVVLPQHTVDKYTAIIDTVDVAQTGILGENQWRSGLNRVCGNQLQKREVDFIAKTLGLNRMVHGVEESAITTEQFAMAAAMAENILALDPKVRMSVVPKVFGDEEGHDVVNLFLADSGEDGLMNLDDLESFMDTGNVDPEIKTKIMSQLREGGNTSITLLQYLTYAPLFLDIHNNLISNLF